MNIQKVQHISILVLSLVLLGLSIALVAEKKRAEGFWYAPNAAGKPNITPITPAKPSHARGLLPYSGKPSHGIQMGCQEAVDRYYASGVNDPLVLGSAFSPLSEELKDVMNNCGKNYPVDMHKPVPVWATLRGGTHMNMM
jgi:hypothetical protein